MGYWLLASDDAEFVKLIFVGIAILVGIVKAITSGGKTKRPSQPKPDWQEILRDLAGEQKPAPPQRPAPPIPAQQRPQQRVQTQRTPRPQRSPAKASRQQRSKPFPRPNTAPAAPEPFPARAAMQEATPVEIIGEDLITATEIGGSGYPKRTSVSRSRLGLTAQSLRKQFIITEVLGPPVGMRESSI